MSALDLTFAIAASASAFLVAVVFGRAALLTFTGRVRAARLGPWTERARLAFTMRSAAFENGAVLAVMFAGGVWIVAPGASMVVPVAAAVAGLLGASIVAWHAVAPLRDQPTPLEQTLVTCVGGVLVLGGPIVAPLVLGVLAIRPFDGVVWALLGLAALLVASAVAGGGFEVGRWLGIVRPASPRLQRITMEVADRMATVPRDVCEIVSSSANACVLPTRRILAFTSSALATLDDAEVAAVCAHELGHLAESRVATLWRVAMSFVLVPVVLAGPLWMSFGPLAPLGLVLGLVTLTLGVGRVSQRLEGEADGMARSYAADPGVYARALEKIYRANLVPAVLGRRHQSHPELWDRMVAAGVTPSYPKPEPPSAADKALSLFVAAVLGMALFAAAVFVRVEAGAVLHAPSRDCQELARVGSGGNVRTSFGNSATR